MIFTKEILEYIDRSVLCWLATSSKDNIPNVSPKEIFASYKEDHIIIANIASPKTVKNIKENPNVCVSFIDVLIQKGYQLKGRATILKKDDEDFEKAFEVLNKITEGLFPFSTITKIKIDSSKPILAPRYVFYKETTEEEQIISARNRYDIKRQC